MLSATLWEQDTSLPAFDKIKAEHVVPGIRALLAALNAEIDALEANVVPTWEGLVDPLERVVDRLGRAWGAVWHLQVLSDNWHHYEFASSEQWQSVGGGGCAGRRSLLGLGRMRPTPHLT